MRRRVALARYGDIERKIQGSVLWDEAMGPLFTNGYFEPCIDVFETAEGTVVKMEIAGMKKKDISVTLVDDTLVVRGRRDDKSHGRKVRYLQMEISYGTFERRIKIGMPIREDKVTAHLRDGFLEVRLPRRCSKG